MQNLLSIGFQPIGYWYMYDDSLELTLNEEIEGNCVYCFIFHGQVMYFGLTFSHLRRRLQQYWYPEQERPNYGRINRQLIETIDLHYTIEILVFKNNASLKLGVFDLNLPLALKQNLINYYNSPWNESLFTTNIISALALDEGYYDVLEPDEELGLEQGIIEQEVPLAEFSIPVLYEYFNNGYIELPDAYADLLADDRASVRVRFNWTTYHGFINFHSSTYKQVTVGAQLSTWITSSFNIGDLIHVRIQSRQVVELYAHEIGFL